MTPPPHAAGTTRRVRTLVAAVALAAGAAPLAAQEPTWSRCDPRPGRTCGARALSRAERAELEALYNAPATRRERGPFALPADSVVRGALAVLGGPVRIAGRVEGALLVLNGDLTLEAGAVVAGEVAVLGGRVTQGEGARTGPLRSEPDSVAYDVDDDDRLALERRADEVWRLLGRDERRVGASMRLAAVRTYNRVEGWPIELGPRLRWRAGWGTLGADAFVVLRTGDRLRLDGEHVGHDARVEARLGRREAVRVGVRAYDVVVPVEAWQLSAVESGLASFLFRSDYRDHYDRHGVALEGAWSDLRAWRIGGALRREDWRPRRTLAPLSLFRSDEPWRPNPQFDAGEWTIGTVGVSYDTRTDPLRPRTGWWLQGSYELGDGRQETLASDAGPGLLPATGDALAVRYGRVEFDLRRYTRLSPSSQLNARLFAAGWVHGDPLPLQRRLSLSGPGALSAFDFRTPVTTPDRLHCLPDVAIPGAPALCDRALLLSVDYRRDIRWLVDLLDAPRFVRTDRSGAAGWVAFVDAGRGWLANPRVPRPATDDGPSGLRAFHASAGLGLELYQGGVYVAKAFGAQSAGVNVFLRLVRRF